MRAVAWPLALALPLLVAACQRDTGAPKAAEAATTAPAATPAAAPGPTSTARVAVTPPPETPSDALASHLTDWDGVVADVTEFRRKGNVLTALVRLRSQGTQIQVIEVFFDSIYVIDEASGKKYQVLRDEKGTPIASSGAAEGILGGATKLMWMKFPAPPPEVRKATLALMKMQPFEDLPIQDR
ncbi:hypothetical protein LuPra_00164 [Luteitalea pratensis]|jgi:hypothetical protein|uniref:Uncharacterized protein n=1 Tax=Luteitalea pratensis TaxID=1855912 RepID=A0A143PFD5_LUTPR|nr:hypothetical protein [Luteitalea pratensis]AMY07000.1 hypothetical protein LuPra_00164 [Luteitalea pratensis]